VVTIKGTTIIMTKGDSAYITVSILNADGTEYVPQAGDTVRFAMKRDYTDQEPLLVINIPTETMELVIRPDDTKDLEAGQIHGRYKYDLELSRENGEVIDTFIPRADFIVLEEVL